MLREIIIAVAIGCVRPRAREAAWRRSWSCRWDPRWRRRVLGKCFDCGGSGPFPSLIPVCHNLDSARPATGWRQQWPSPGLLALGPFPGRSWIGGSVFGSCSVLCSAPVMLWWTARWVSARVPRIVRTCPGGALRLAFPNLSCCARDSRHTLLSGSRF